MQTNRVKEYIRHLTSYSGIRCQPTACGSFRQCFLFLITAFSVLLLHAGICAQSPDARVICSRESYCYNDTVILALQVHIPDGFVLIGNPKGPGIGRPMKIWITSPDSSIRWLEVRKTKAEKYGPAFGEWVWAYSGTAPFFCTGVLDGVAPGRTITGTVMLECLFCSSECRLESTRVPFSFKVSDRLENGEHFYFQSDLLDQFKKSSPMMPLERTRF